MPYIKVPIYRKYRLDKDDSIISEDTLTLTLEISNELLEKLLLSPDEVKREINHFATRQVTMQTNNSKEENNLLLELTRKHGMIAIEVGLNGEIEIIKKPAIN